MKKKTICLLLAALCLCTLFWSCTQKNQVVNYEVADLNTTTITFFGNKYEPENVRVIEAIISGFMAEHPDIRVSYESLKGANYFDALEKRIASGKGDDVFMVNHDVLLQLERDCQLADLSALSVIPHYTKAMRTQMEDADGAIYWVPTTVSMFGLYCNLDLLQQHGQTVPQTLGEWEQVCDFFAEQGVTPIVANNDISLKTLAIGVGFFPLYQQGCQQDVFDRLNRGEERLSDYLRPGFSLVASFIERGYVDARETLDTRKTSDDLQAFAKGEAPFLLTGAWAAGRLDEMSPPFSFEVAPLPVLEDGAMLVINADTRLSVYAKSDHLDAAKKFVEYFTLAENIKKFADQQSSFSPLTDGDPSLVKEIQPLLPCYEEGRIVFGSDGLLELPIWKLTAEVSKKLLSGQSLETALTWMDRQIEEGLQR